MSPCLGALLLSLAGFAQSPAPPPSQDTEHTWSIATGRETASFRDVSRSGIPIESSPVALDGRGPLMSGRYERRRPGSSQAIAAVWVRASDFTLETPVSSLPAADDRFSRLELRYEYQRVFWRDRWVRGLAWGAGPVGLGAWQAIERHPSAGTTVRVTDAEAGGGGIVSTRLARWDRVRLDAALTTALVMGGVTEGGAPVTLARPRQAGGGWLIESRVSAAVRLWPRVWISAGYQSAGQMRIASHRSQSDRRARVEVGVTHVR